MLLRALLGHLRVTNTVGGFTGGLTGALGGLMKSVTGG
jgi:hypothetical protein